MRPLLIAIALIAGMFLVPGCAPQAVDAAGGGDVLGAVLSASSEAAPAGAPAVSGEDVSGVPAADPPTESRQTSRTFAGTFSGAGTYRLYDLGPGVRGDGWTVTVNGSLSGPFVVVLFDANNNLLMRTYMSYNRMLQHVVRADTEHVYLGVMPPAGYDGGTFHLKATLRPGQSVPPPRAQVVWLNFAGGAGVVVHNQEPVSFAPLRGGMIDEMYADATQEIKASIVREMRADYAAYNVTILTSDDGPLPDGPVSVVHFGARSAGLLGLADDVDNYNQDRSQAAMVYIENFGPYRTMKLTPEEMGVMIANVASHELGHLLGLYHTVNHDDLMDTTGSAWDLAGEQDFRGGALEPTVFATGFEDGPALLEQTLGLSSRGAKAGPQAKALQTVRYREIRRLAEEELAHACGTCQHLDE